MQSRKAPRSRKHITPRKDGQGSGRAAPNGGAVWLAAGFLIFVAACVLTGKLPSLVAGLYLAASALTFVMYAKDKAAARRGDWRTPESHLHLLALAGGWPGAIVAQRLLRHKSSKAAFRTVFRGTVVVNCGVLAAFLWLGRPAGLSG